MRFCRDYIQHTVRLCRQCYQQAEQTNTLSRVLLLAYKGHWMCPFSKPQCGTILNSKKELTQ